MYFITISQMLGTNGEKIARKVAEELKYTFYRVNEKSIDLTISLYY